MCSDGVYTAPPPLQEDVDNVIQSSPLPGLN